MNYRVLDQIASRTSLVIDFGGGIKTDEDLVIVHPEDHVNDPQPAAVKSATDALVNALAFKPHKLGTDK